MLARYIYDLYICVLYLGQYFMMVIINLYILPEESLDIHIYDL